MSTDPSQKPSISPEPRWVSRELAAEWMDSINVGNRSQSEAHVRLWVDRLNLGRYQTTHQGLAFDENGMLIDGQTRLAALVRSDVPGMWIQVTTGVPRAAFAVMDAGRNRQAAQLIPAPHATTKGGAARLLLSYPKLLQPNGKRLETADILDSYDTYKDAIDDAAVMAYTVYRGCGIQPAVHTALIAAVIAAAGGPASMLPGWIEGLATGAGLDEDDPRLALRNRWSVDKKRLNSGGREARTEAAFFLTRAWNAYVDGVPMTKLQLPRGAKVTADNMPEVTR